MFFQDIISIIEAACAIITATFTTYSLVALIKKDKNITEKEKKP